MNQKLKNLYSLMTSPDKTNRDLGKEVMKGLDQKEQGKINYRLKRDKRTIEGGESLFWEAYGECSGCKLFGDSGPGKCPLPIAVIAFDCKISLYIAEQIGIEGLDDTYVTLSRDCKKKQTEAKKGKKRVPKNQTSLF